MTVAAAATLDCHAVSQDIADARHGTRLGRTQPLPRTFRPSQHATLQRPSLQSDGPAAYAACAAITTHYQLRRQLRSARTPAKLLDEWTQHGKAHRVQSRALSC